MEKRIMTAIQDDYCEFESVLNERLNQFGCKNNQDLTRQVLETEWNDIDVTASLDYFKEHHGYCDCEILANVGKNGSDAWKRLYEATARETKISLEKTSFIEICEIANRLRLEPKKVKEIITDWMIIDLSD